MPPESPSPVAIALGANLGNRKENFQRAIDSLISRPEIGDFRASSFYETAPVGYSEQPPFLNAAAFFLYQGNPEQLLAVLQSIEKDAGKATPFPNGPRTLDLDIIFFGGLQQENPGLEIPHPRWAERSFVVDPLKELTKLVSTEQLPSLWREKIALAAQTLGRH